MIHKSYFSCLRPNPAKYRLMTFRRQSRLKREYKNVLVKENKSVIIGLMSLLLSLRKRRMCCSFNKYRYCTVNKEICMLSSLRVKKSQAGDGA
jgi:hypothetical protein